MADERALDPARVAEVEEALAEVERPPTPDEVARVRRFECRSHGTHNWAADYQLGNEDPVAIHCTHCGRTCPVGPGRPGA